MKKKSIISLLLALVMCFGLCACGEGDSAQKQSKDELLSSAVELDGYTLYQEYESNKEKAHNEYEGTACLVEGTICAIEKKYITVEDSNLKVNVYLTTEEILELETNQLVKVAGILENIGLEQNSFMDYVTGDFKTGYFVTDRFEVKGIVQTAGIVLVDSEGKANGNIKTVHWAEGVDKSQYTWQEVTISAKCMYNDMTEEIEYFDATIVE